LNHRTPLTDEVYWPLVDHLGSVRDVAVCAGGTTSVSNHLVYSAFGQVLDETPGGVQLPFAFTGRELDRETDQYYYRARYYDAAAGKFLSEDPVGFQAGDANLSRYVQNGPTTCKTVQPPRRTPAGWRNSSNSRKWVPCQAIRVFRGLAALSSTLHTNLRRREPSCSMATMPSKSVANWYS